MTVKVPPSWVPIDLEPIISGEFEPEQPDLLARQDGPALLYRGRLHAVFGEPESCKGWFSLEACRAAIVARETVVHIDFEDNERNITRRLRDLDIPHEEILDRFRYVRPEERVCEAVHELLVAESPALVVIDGVTEALVVEGLGMADNQDVAEFYRRLGRPFARAGAAVLLVDHVVKDKDARGRYAIGAQHKLAGVDVAYRLDVVHPFGRGRKGLVKVSVTKDRAGAVREHAGGGERIADMRLVSTPNGVSVRLEAPEGADKPWRPTVLMKRISDAVITTPGLTAREIRELTGSSDHLDKARQLLIDDGYVKPSQDGKAIRHYSIRPFNDQADVIELGMQREMAA